jgi:hypothetical protein
VLLHNTRQINMPTNPGNNAQRMVSNQFTLPCRCHYPGAKYTRLWSLATNHGTSLDHERQIRLSY